MAEAVELVAMPAQPPGAVWWLLCSVLSVAMPLCFGDHTGVGETVWRRCAGGCWSPWLGVAGILRSVYSTREGSAPRAPLGVSSVQQLVRAEFIHSLLSSHSSHLFWFQ